MNRGMMLGIRRTPTDVEREGARTTVAGVASSRASAAPSLRYGPSGDPTPTTVEAAYMAESTLSARN